MQYLDWTRTYITEYDFRLRTPELGNSEDCQATFFLLFFNILLLS